jgi:peptide deformylase
MHVGGVIRMARLEIRKDGDPVLREKAQKVPKVTKRILKVLNDMEETMYAADGVGLAAPQVGISERLVVIDVGEGPIHLINPEVTETQGRDIESEGCLSFPGLYGYVERAARVRVTFMDRNGKEKRIDATGLLARALQHEIDHLDGVLFVDKAKQLEIDDKDTDE